MAIEVFNSGGGSAELQAKTGITPTTSSQTITPDSGYDGLSSVQINGMSSGTLNTPSVDANGLVTASVGTSGFLDSGTSKTLQLSTQGATTITPSTSAQTAVASGKYTTGAVTVSAMSSGALSTPTVNSSGLVTASVGTSGYLASGTSSTLQLSTQSAKTVTPSTSSQTAVASGKYTTGAVTVSGDSNLVASNIKSGVSIFGVSGSLVEGYKQATVSAVRTWADYGIIFTVTDLPTTATEVYLIGVLGVEMTFASSETYYIMSFNGRLNASSSSGVILIKSGYTNLTLTDMNIPMDGKLAIYWSTSLFRNSSVTLSDTITVFYK